MAYDIEALRKKLQQSQGGKFNDPNEFRPAKATSDKEPTVYRFFILPPVITGEVLASGIVKKGMEMFYVPVAHHWINDKPHACPRIFDDSHCELCQFGFDLLKGEKDENKRKDIVKQFMPTQYFRVNILFTNSKLNPEDLRGTVKWFNAPKTCFDMWTTALMRDDAGDPEDPKAYGVFFDENNAFPFDLNVIKDGKNNGYKRSKFLTKSQPMIALADGSPDKEALTEMLKNRHDLWSRIDVPDKQKIKSLANAIINGDGDSSDSNSGYETTEEAPSKASGNTSKTTTTVSESAGSTGKKKPEDESSEKKTTPKFQKPNPADNETPEVVTPKPKAAPAVSESSETVSEEMRNLLGQLDDDD